MRQVSTSLRVRGASASQTADSGGRFLWWITEPDNLRAQRIITRNKFGNLIENVAPINHWLHVHEKSLPETVMDWMSMTGMLVSTTYMLVWEVSTAGHHQSWDTETGKDRLPRAPRAVTLFHSVRTGETGHGHLHLPPHGQGEEAGRPTCSLHWQRIDPDHISLKVFCWSWEFSW